LLVAGCSTLQPVTLIRNRQPAIDNLSDGHEIELLVMQVDVRLQRERPTER
jgi:hypothetical protein